MSGPVRVRMAPSPTGPLHIGTARTALFNWLFARQYGGTFILRLEDTDRERSTLESELDIMSGLKWLGLDWDEGPERGNYGPYRQTERKEIYDRYLNRLLQTGRAYYCYCTREEMEAERAAMESQGLSYHYPGRCRDLQAPPPGKTRQLIRLRVPAGRVEFNDLIRDKVSVDSGELDDFAIARSNGEPLYNFAVAVDDIEMKITHVIRGEDHLPNTPKQILVYQALGVDLPRFGHLPLILDTDRSKLSKRSGKTNFQDYIDQGYLPDAIFNFLALLGWHPKGDEEILSRAEIVAMFDLSRVQKSGAIFNLEKLSWLNAQYIKQLSDADLAQALRPFLTRAGYTISSEEYLVQVAAVSRDRLRTLSDIAAHAGFFFQLADYAPSLLPWKESPREETLRVLRAVREAIRALDPAAALEPAVINSTLAELVNQEGKGQVFWPLRVALSGLRASPDPISIIGVLGQTETLRRLSLAIEKLGNNVVS
ncbi:MAG: glutamate--tRNA ligase [Candidatus Liptonbacteria bacterium]|nr:glutamate--tRNA ligase [Candidatus Liptonbacteria bacterium]